MQNETIRNRLSEIKKNQKDFESSLTKSLEIFL